MRCPKFQFIEQFIFTFSQTPEIFFWWLLTNNLLWTKKNIFLSHWLAFLCKYYLVLNTQTTWVRRINKYLLKLFYQFPLVIEPINMAIGGEWGSAAPSLKYNTRLLNATQNMYDTHKIHKIEGFLHKHSICHFVGIIIVISSKSINDCTFTMTNKNAN